MFEKSYFPAETYKLNVLASVLGRYAIPDLSQKSFHQIGEMLDATTELLEKNDAPEVPHTEPVLLEEAALFDQKLLQQLEVGPASNLLNGTHRKKLTSIIARHQDFCLDAYNRSAKSELLTNPRAVACAYELPDLFNNSQQIIHEEVQKWGYSTEHPATNNILQQKVNIGETKGLIRLMAEKVIGISVELNVNAYITDDVDNYHVFWAPHAEGLDYATPSSYDRATQLSFDLPHNVSHLVHLQAMKNEAGAMRYIDDPASRAYFEAIAVLSEHDIYWQLKNSPELAAEILAACSLEPGNSFAAELAKWIVEDRKYEFKLRASRYAADVLMLEGQDFASTANSIQNTFGISKTDAENEVKKYLPWTGLGAAYTYGYRELLNYGYKKPRDAILLNGKVITSWSQFYSESMDSI